MDQRNHAILLRFYSLSDVLPREFSAALVPLGSFLLHTSPGVVGVFCCTLPQPREFSAALFPPSGVFCCTLPLESREFSAALFPNLGSFLLHSSLGASGV